MPKEDKGKIRVFLFELEGTNETLLESVRSITGALNQTFSGGQRTVRLISGSNSQNPVDTIEQVVEVVDEDDYEESDSPRKTASGKQSPRKPRRVTTPELIAELEFESGSISLKDFVASKNPSSDIKKYLVIAVWLKQQRQIEEISTRHIFTCYRALGWTLPKDIGQIFRNGKGDGFFVSGSSKGTFKLSYIGEDKVQTMS